MPSAKQRAMQDMLRKGIENMDRGARRGRLGDVDVTPKRDEYEPSYAERMERDQPLKMTQGIANEIDNELREWLKKQKTKLKHEPSRQEIESFRAKLTDRYRATVPEVEPTPEIRETPRPKTKQWT